MNFELFFQSQLTKFILGEKKSFKYFETNDYIPPLIFINCISYRGHSLNVLLTCLDLNKVVYIFGNES